MAESNYTELDVSSHSDSDDFSNLESKEDALNLCLKVVVMLVVAVLC